MSLDRRDIRAKLDPEVHRYLKVLARVQRITDAELTERVMREYLRNRVHATTVAAARLQLAGITGTGGEKPGAAGNRGSR